MSIHVDIADNKLAVELLYGDGFINLKKELFQPGQGELWHFHKHKDQIFYCIDGSLTILQPGNKSVLSSGDSIMIKALLPHAIWNNSEKDVSFYLFSTGSDYVPDKFIIDLKPVEPESTLFMLNEFVVQPMRENDLSEFALLVSKNRSRLQDFPNTIKAIDQGDINFDFFKEKAITPYLIKSGTVIIGYIGLKNINPFDRSVELGYWIDENLEGKGIFQKLLTGFMNQLLIAGAFRNIKASVKTYNIRNLRLLERLHFQLESSNEHLNYLLTGKNYFKYFGNIRVVEYSPQYKMVFRDLNIEWISQHFLLEGADLEVLDFPEQNIIKKGGNIFFVLVNDEAVATAALLKVNDEVFELIKMATNPVFRDLGLGNLLLEKAIDWARGHFIKQLILYTQSSLFQALKLYRRYGFINVPLEPGHYERADVKMVLDLET